MATVTQVTTQMGRTSKLKLEDRVAGVGEEEEPLTLEDYLESIPDLFEPPQAMQGGTEPDVEGSDEESEDTLNVTIGSKMSPNNRCDYRLFKCIDAAGDTRLMAIVDAKKTIDVHAIAQLVGYYSRSDAIDQEQMNEALLDILNEVPTFRQAKATRDTQQQQHDQQQQQGGQGGAGGLPPAGGQPQAAAAEQREGETGQLCATHTLGFLHDHCLHSGL